MRSIVIQKYGSPEQLAIREVPEPETAPDHVIIEAKTFGLHHAEIYFRKGVCGDLAEISGIECVGLVETDPLRRFAPVQKVAALTAASQHPPFIQCN